MASKTTTSKSAQLAALEDRVTEAEGRLDQIRRESARASRALKRAEGARLALEESRGAGEDVSDEDMAAAVKAIAEAREAADPAVWKARADGAERAIDDAKLERDTFGRREFAAIAVEEIPLDEPAREALVTAWEALQEAGNAYAIRVRRWHRLARYGGLDTATIPTSPLAGDVEEVAQQFEAGLEVPTPRVLR